jgi:hypothetical protein
LAIYHCRIQIISRGKDPKSAVAAAAYRSGETIRNNYDGVTHNYTKKKGVVHTEIMLPEQAPPEYKDRAVLWNAVEQIEKSKNSQLARELEIALPRELSAEKNIALVQEYAKHTFVEQGMCADIAVHDKGDGNPHAHIMLTLRPFEPDGSWGAKSKKEYILDKNGERIKLKSGEYKSRKINAVNWNEQTKAEEWRSAWADYVNRFLESESIAERVDHRSYERQGIDQIPTIHMGAAATAMERRGIRTERGDRNRLINEINLTNRHIRQLRARLNKLINWSADEAVTTAPITLHDIISEILSRGGNKITNLKNASQILIFLQNNGLYYMSDLQAKIGDMYKQQDGLRAELKPVERRLKTLDTHIEQAEYHREFKAVYKKYKEQKPKKQAAFREAHHREITLYEAAEKYFKQHLNGRTEIPLKAWKSERVKLTAEKEKIYRDYNALKDETRKVEQIKKSVENILREDGRESAPVRKHGVEL